MVAVQRIADLLGGSRLTLTVIGAGALLAACSVEPASTSADNSSASRQPTTLEMACAAGQAPSCRLEAAADGLDEWWAQRAPDYSSPRVIVLEGPTVSACGTLDRESLAVYCGADRSIYLSVEDLDAITGGGRAAIFVLAHEWAHHAQHLAGLDEEQYASSQAVPELAPALSVAYELMADCLAGAWLTSADERATSGPTDADDYLDVMLLVGALADEGDLPDDITLVPETFTHGSAEQRQAWTSVGFGSTVLEMDPLGACDTFESLAAAVEERAGTG